jgi:5-methylcytosine-specific restriction endonuclease McrA
MGIQRSTQKVANKLKKSKALIGRWSSKHNWSKRVAAYDIWMSSSRLNKQVDYEAQLLASDFETLIAVNRAILIRLEETPEDFTPNELLRMSKKLFRRYGDKVAKKRIDSGMAWLALRFSILERDGFTCQYCGQSPLKHGIVLHVDHITPRSKGGDNSRTNLIASCHICNLGKMDVLLSQREEEKLMLGLI